MASAEQLQLEASKLQTLAKSEGYYDPLDMLEDAVWDSVVPGICMNKDCDYTTGCEPDARENWCEVCQTNTVKSCLELAFIGM
jgi:hypothetical protein